MMKSNGIIFIIMACFLWAIDTLIRYPLVFSGESIAQIVFWEHGILLVLFSGFLVKSFKKLNTKPMYWILFIILGTGGSAAATLMFTKAFSLAHPTVVVLIQKTQPIFALILARLWLKETFSKKFFYLVPLAFIGALILMGDDLVNLMSIFKGSYHDSLTGYIYAFGASLLWGGATIIGRYLTLEGFKPSEMTALRVFFATLFFIPYFAIIQNVENFIPTFPVFIKISTLSFLSGVLGLSLYYRGLKTTKAKFATIAEMTFPIWVIGLNWIVLNKTISLLQVIGAVILLISIYLLQMNSMPLEREK